MSNTELADALLQVAADLYRQRMPGIMTELASDPVANEFVTSDPNARTLHSVQTMMMVPASRFWK